MSTTNIRVDETLERALRNGKKRVEKKNNLTLNDTTFSKMLGSVLERGLMDDITNSIRIEPPKKRRKMKFIFDM